MSALDEMIAAAIEAGRLTRIPTGHRTLPTCEVEGALGKVRPETCGAGHPVARRPSLSSMDDDQS